MMTPKMKIEALIHVYEYELEDKKKELESLKPADVTHLFKIATVQIDIKWIEKFLKELKH